MKVVIGADHLGMRFIDELSDTFPDVEFVAAYDVSEQPGASVDADVFFGWPTRDSFLAAKSLRWIHCPGMGIDRTTKSQ